MNNKNKIHCVFIGTPSFAVPSLLSLINHRQFDIIAIITQPDKKTGRKQIITPPPVKVEAEKYNIPVYQPEKIKDLRLKMEELNPDLIIVAAYAQIIPENILNIPKHGTINIHGSLLPEYRGASCIQAAILNGNAKTGVTIMKIDKGLDTGPIITQSLIDIAPDDTAGSLYEKLSELGAKTLLSSLKKYIAGEIKPRPQDNSRSSYAGLLKKQDGKIDWKKSADEIEKFIRAMSPWPSAFASLKIKNPRNKRDKQKSPQQAGQAKIKNNYINIKIVKVKHETLKINKHKIGELFLHDENLTVQCGQDALIIKRLQLEGKKEMAAEEFLRGYKNLIGNILK